VANALLLPFFLYLCKPQRLDSNHQYLNRAHIYCPLSELMHFGGKYFWREMFFGAKYFWREIFLAGILRL
jgi:hypothetical protein